MDKIWNGEMKGLIEKLGIDIAEKESLFLFYFEERQYQYDAQQSSLNCNTPQGLTPLSAPMLNELLYRLKLAYFHKISDQTYTQLEEGKLPLELGQALKALEENKKTEYKNLAIQLAEIDAELQQFEPERFDEVLLINLQQQREDLLAQLNELERITVPEVKMQPELDTLAVQPEEKTKSIVDALDEKVSQFKNQLNFFKHETTKKIAENEAMLWAKHKEDDLLQKIADFNELEGLETTYRQELTQLEQKLEQSKEKIYLMEQQDKDKADAIASSEEEIKKREFEKKLRCQEEKDLKERKKDLEGKYNQEIIKIKRDQQELTKEIDSIRSQIPSINSEIKALNAQMSVVKDELNAVERNIQKLENQIASWSGWFILWNWGNYDSVKQKIKENEENRTKLLRRVSELKTKLNNEENTLKQKNNLLSEKTSKVNALTALKDKTTQEHDSTIKQIDNKIKKIQDDAEEQSIALALTKHTLSNLLQEYIKIKSKVEEESKERTYLQNSIDMYKETLQKIDKMKVGLQPRLAATHQQKEEPTQPALNY